ncbi:hypothetical protein [Rhodococcus sp. H29-C3]|nr:hypothetical protein [Rhodococcus sp. H29-C3]MDJ0363460.1 hypothetical protein [Rhodococcus sp. H29-C3]
MPLILAKYKCVVKVHAPRFQLSVSEEAGYLAVLLAEAVELLAGSVANPV